MTVRNIRAHQSRGLLPAPTVKGRIGYYDHRHIARLELIQQLQAGGFNLTAIQRLVERAERSGEEIGNLRSLVLAPFNDEQTEVMNIREFSAQTDLPIDRDLIDRGIAAGFIIPIGGDNYEVISPTLFRAGIEALSLGVPTDALFKVLEQVQRHTRAVADVLTKMVDDQIVHPYEDGGFAPEEWPHVRNAIERLRPLASEVMLASFKTSMNESAEDAFGRVLTRVARDGKPGRRRTNSRRAESVAADARSVVKSVAKSAGSKPSRRSSVHAESSSSGKTADETIPAEAGGSKPTSGRRDSAKRTANKRDGTR